MGTQTTSWALKFTNLRNTGLEKVSRGFTAIDKKVGVFETKTNNAFKSASNSGKAFFAKTKLGISQLSGQFPVLGSAIELISNPIVLATALVIGLGAVLGKATAQAEVFNNEFLELRNLNLDKTTGQINALQDSVLNLSLAEGFDPQETSRAFFDIQSATGKFGEEVELSVQKIGRFSRAVKADFNQSVEGAAKAMGIFGFGVNELDQFLASSFKTVQVGVTTFDQLAKSQVIFAGSAAAIGQGFDEANKLFAIFTKNADTVAEAATLTKTAFQDLTKKSTLEGFRKIGVEVFDVNGNMLQLDKIIEQLVPRFASLTNQEFAALKEDIGGSEGIKGLLDLVKNSGDEVLAIFKAFDETEFDSLKLLENANGDLTIMKKIVGNQINVVMIKLGQKILPGVIRALQLISDLITFMSTPFEKLSASAQFFRLTLDAILLPLGLANDQMEIQAQLGEKIRGSFGRGVDSIKRKIKELFEFIGGEGNLFAKMFDESGSVFANIKADVDRLNQIFATAIKGFAALATNNLKEFGKQSIILDKLLKDFGTGAGPIAPRLAPSPGGIIPPGSIIPPPDGDDGGGTGGAVVTTGVSEVVGGGARVRNINITIDKLSEITINVKESITEATEDIERQITEVLIKAVRDGELALSSD